MGRDPDLQGGSPAPSSGEKSGTLLLLGTLVQLKLSFSGFLFLGRRVAKGTVLSDGSQQSQPRRRIFGRKTVDRLHGDGGHAQRLPSAATSRAI